MWAVYDGKKIYLANSDARYDYVAEIRYEEHGNGTYNQEIISKTVSPKSEIELGCETSGLASPQVGVFYHSWEILSEKRK